MFSIIVKKNLGVEYEKINMGYEITPFLWDNTYLGIRIIFPFTFAQNVLFYNSKINLKICAKYSLFKRFEPLIGSYVVRFWFWEFLDKKTKYYQKWQNIQDK